MASETRPVPDNRATALPRWPRPAQVALGIVAVALLIVATAPTLLYPFTRDQGAFAYIADLMMNGGVPYRDALDLKPPGVYWVYQAAFTLFGRSELAVRLFETLYTLLSAGTVYALAHAAFDDRTLAAASAWVYAFSYFLLLHFYSVANPEAFLVPLVTLCFYGAVRCVRGRRDLWLWVGSIAGGMALWFKPTAGLTVAAAVLWAAVAVWRDEKNAYRLVRTLGIAALGGLLGLAPAVLLLYGNGLVELLGLWSQYGSGAYLAAGGLALGGGPLAMLDVIVGYVREWQLWVWLTLTGLAVVAVKGRHTRSEPQAKRPQGPAVVVFWLSALVTVLLQGKLFEYHWIPALAPASILSALALVMIARGIRGAMSTSSSHPGCRPSVSALLFAAIVISGLLAMTAYDHVVRYRRLASYLTGGISEEQYYAQFDIGSDFSRMGTLRAAAYLQAHTQPSDTVFIWGAEPLVNFLAQRRSPTKYIFSYMLVGGEQGGDLEARRQEFLNGLHQDKPAYFVLVEGDITPLSPQGSLAQLEQLPGLRALLEEEYALEVQIEDYTLYRRVVESKGVGSMKEVSSAGQRLISAFHTTHV